jgi:hypothetical protein
LHEKKEDDSTRKYVAEEQDNAPPELDDVRDLNKQFETHTPVPEGVCVEVGVCEFRLFV